MNEQRQLFYKQKVRTEFSNHNENNQWRMTAADPAARGPSYVQNTKSRGFFQTRFLSFDRRQYSATLVHSC